MSGRLAVKLLAWIPVHKISRTSIRAVAEQHHDAFYVTSSWLGPCRSARVELGIDHWLSRACPGCHQHHAQVMP